MIRYIWIWLMLRLLQDQENHFISENPNSERFITRGIRASVGLQNFVDYCSKKNLLVAILPTWALRYFRPDHTDRYADVSPNLKKLRAAHSMIDSAIDYGFISYGNKRNGEGIIEVNRNFIRISPSGDEVVGYFGFLESFVKKFPATWILITLSFVPTIVTHRQTIGLFITKWL